MTSYITHDSVHLPLPAYTSNTEGSDCIYLCMTINSCKIIIGVFLFTSFLVLKYLLQRFQRCIDWMQRNSRNKRKIQDDQPVIRANKVRNKPYLWFTFGTHIQCVVLYTRKYITGGNHSDMNDLSTSKLNLIWLQTFLKLEKIK